MNEEHENTIEFVESRKDSPKPFQASKQAFDFIALLIHFLAVLPRTYSIALGWHNRVHFKFHDQLACFIALISSIHNHMRAFPAFIFKGLQQLSAFRRITGLSWRKRKSHRRSGICGNQVNFGGPTCARFTNRLWTVFFNAPVPSGCTFTAVLSSEIGST